MGKQQIPFLVPPGPKREDILAGTKTVTIRVDDRPCSAGDELVLFCHIVPWVVMADVVTVRRCKLSEVTAEEFKTDGYDDPATAMGQFITNLKPYHPEVNPDSIVTVIRFTNVSGKLVDEYKTAERRSKGLCPKCGSDQSDHEVRNFDAVSRDGNVYCKKCNTKVRYFDPS